MTMITRAKRWCSVLFRLSFVLMLALPFGISRRRSPGCGRRRSDPCRA